MANHLRRRHQGDRRFVRRPRSPLYCRRYRASRIFRRDAQQRSPRHLDSPPAGSEHQRQHFPRPPVDLRLATRHRQIETRRNHRRHVRAPHRCPPHVDGERLRLSRRVHARRRTLAAETKHQRDSRRRGRRRDERRIRTQLADSSRGVRHGAPDRVRQRCKSFARSRRQPPCTDRRSSCHRRDAARNHHASPDRKRAARGGRRNCRLNRRHGSRSTASLARVPQRALSPDQHHTFAHRPRICVCARVDHRHNFWRRSRLVRHAHRSRRRAARHGPRQHRSFNLRAQSSSRHTSNALRRARRWRNDARPQPQQTRASGFRLPGRKSRRARDTRSEQ